MPTKRPAAASTIAHAEADRPEILWPAVTEIPGGSIRGSEYGAFAPMKWAGTELAAAGAYGGGPVIGRWLGDGAGIGEMGCTPASICAPSSVTPTGVRPIGAVKGLLADGGGGLMLAGTVDFDFGPTSVCCSSPSLSPSETSGRRSAGGGGRSAPSFARLVARADSSVALITAAGDMLVVDALGPIEPDAGIDFFTILGAPRTAVRPSSSSSAPVTNLPGRDDIGGGGTGERREAGGGGRVVFGFRGSCTVTDREGMKFVTSSSVKGLGGDTLRFDIGGGATLAGFWAVAARSAKPSRSSFVKTSSSSSPRPGRFVKGSMILRRLVPSCLAKCKPERSASMQKYHGPKPAKH
jgi:hypothetical protein